MKLNNALFLNEQKETPEASIEYFREPTYGYDEQDRGNLAVKLSQFSILATKTLRLKEFWDKRKESKLAEQFIKATFELGRKYKVIDNTKRDFESYKSVVENLFGTKKPKGDIIFYLEPGYNFKGLFKEERFSIARVKHDEGEAKRGAWAKKERGELTKLK